MVCTFPAYYILFLGPGATPDRYVRTLSSKKMSGIFGRIGQCHSAVFAAVIVGTVNSYQQ